MRVIHMHQNKFNLINTNLANATHEHSYGDEHRRLVKIYCNYLLAIARGNVHTCKRASNVSRQALNSRFYCLFIYCILYIPLLGLVKKISFDCF